MRGKVVSLSVHRNTLEQRRRQETRRELKAVARDALSSNPEGFVLVSYRRDPDGTLIWSGGYHASNAMDRYGLADAARNIVQRRLDGD